MPDYRVIPAKLVLAKAGSRNPCSVPGPIS